MRHIVRSNLSFHINRERFVLFRYESSSVTKRRDVSCWYSSGVTRKPGVASRGRVQKLEEPRRRFLLDVSLTFSLIT